MADPLDPQNPWTTMVISIAAALGLREVVPRAFRWWTKREDTESNDRREEAKSWRQSLLDEVAVLRKELAAERMDSDQRERAVREEKHKDAAVFHQRILDLHVAHERCEREVAALKERAAYAEKTVAALTNEVSLLRAEILGLRERAVGGPH